MFGLVRNFVFWIKKKQNKHMTIVVIGVNNAGKTTLLTALKGDNPDLVTPTVGFSNQEVTYGRVKLNIFDLGGAENFRGIWKHYYAEVFGAIYVLDSTDKKSLEVSKNCLLELVKDPRFEGKPILILANKRDLPNASTVDDISREMELDQLQLPSYRILSCRALTKEGDPIDDNITRGVRWLVDSIDTQYRSLFGRVEAKAREKQEREEKRKRIEAARRQREIEAAERAEREEKERQEATNQEPTSQETEAQMKLEVQREMQPEQKKEAQPIQSTGALQTNDQEATKEKKRESEGEKVTTPRREPPPPYSEQAAQESNARERGKEEKDSLTPRQPTGASCSDKKMSEIVQSESSKERKEEETQEGADFHPLNTPR
ncbi:ADP-ribosylation factor-like protein 13B-like [Planoprotostelium fungivorum]|uniref:ADP-ribosylation factor-like protein 13B-like n=1 Tax=Planoprotostelium fungivorum TaxID=1890364 RepID=A0A2P6N5Q6_9EUKA|nr:ADP-ribosylation factor-like protein 13B-like [Planoprotostelium fungivorum]